MSDYRLGPRNLETPTRAIGWVVLPPSRLGIETHPPRHNRVAVALSGGDTSPGLERVIAPPRWPLNAALDDSTERRLRPDPTVPPREPHDACLPSGRKVVNPQNPCPL